ncbi:MAG: hypothetical protein KDA47_08585, partial [Planctomycetales bacterium]|nr:hypothetical protein [Planctomycetales bacterium]
SGQKFNDLNADGVKNGGEPGLSPWTIFADLNNNGTLDGGEPSAVTNAAGNYSLTGLGPGNYQIREVQQSGWTQSTANPAPIAAASGTNVANIDFGNFQSGTISGRKFNDMNGDASGAGDPGLMNWTIFTDADNDGVSDVGETSVTTGAGGAYSFPNLAPGNYIIREVQQSNWIRTTANPAPIAVTSGATINNVDFGNFRTIDISGQKYNDMDGNGTKDGGDGGLQSWTIFLDANNNGVFDVGETNVATDPLGNYSFTGLGPGTYNVREVVQTGWTQTSTNPAPINAASGSNATNVDFGNFQNFTISGTKFHDANNSGTRDPGEPGIDNVTIQLVRDANNNGVNDDAVLNSMMTAGGGLYSFTGLTPGRYFVQEIVPPGNIQTAPVGGFHTIVGQSGATFGNRDFGNTQTPGFTGRKFNDVNGDATDNGGADPGLGGWIIEMYQDDGDGMFEPNVMIGGITLNGDDGAPIATAVTQPGTGNYVLGSANLPTGSYFVREVQRQGWHQTTPGSEYLISHVMGTPNAGLDFGNMNCTDILSVP